MVGYVIPFRPKARTKDWEGALSLLRQTLRSILAAKEGALQIFVVSHDLSGLEGFEKTPVHFEVVDFALPMQDDHTAYQHDRNWKVTRGCQLAAQRGVDWVFVCDADDLVSCELNGIIEHSKHADAVMIQHGYEVSARNHRAFPRSNLEEICGSTFALRTTHVFFKKTTAFWDGIFLRQNHKNLENYLRRNELMVEEPKRPLVAYLRRHGGNVSDAMARPSIGSRMREWMKFGFLGVSFSGDLAREFGYLEEPPADPRLGTTASG